MSISVQLRDHAHLSIITGGLSTTPPPPNEPEGPNEREASCFTECTFVSRTRCKRRIVYGRDQGPDFDYWANATYCEGSDENHLIGHHYRDMLVGAVHIRDYEFTEKGVYEPELGELLFSVLQDQVASGAFHHPRKFEVLEGFWLSIADEWRCDLIDRHRAKQN